MNMLDHIKKVLDLEKLEGALKNVWITNCVFCKKKRSLLIKEDQNIWLCHNCNSNGVGYSQIYKKVKYVGTKIKKENENGK